jgi:NAD-dependent dihydropyrimidine dehydrogenase PreA subunit
MPITDNTITLVASRYTPAEAGFLTDLPLSPKTIEDLAGFKNLGTDELRKKLDDLAGRGLVYTFTKNDKRFYILNDIYTALRAWGWPGLAATPENKQFADLLEVWETEYMAPWAHVQEMGLRTIPIQQAVEDDRQILAYEDIGKVLDSYKYFCVTECGCRLRHNLADVTPDCKYPTDNCLHFDRLAHYCVDNGLGREISKQQAVDILHRSADLGLVLGISNQQMGTDTICSCCTDCCMWFDGMRKLKQIGAATGTLTPSNYRIHTNDQTCTGCGLCVKRCPMDALQLKDAPTAKGRKTLLAGEGGKEKTLTNKTGKLAAANTDLCIGCGVCVIKCPSKSLTLVRNETVHHPPETGRDWVMQFIADTASLRAGEKA